MSDYNENSAEGKYGGQYKGIGPNLDAKKVGLKGTYTNLRKWEVVPDSAFTPEAMKIIKRQREQVVLDIAATKIKQNLDLGAAKLTAKQVEK